MKIVDVTRDTELHRNAIVLLHRETIARVDLDVIDQLCEFFNCEAGEPVERIEDQVPNA